MKIPILSGAVGFLLFSGLSGLGQILEAGVLQAPQALNQNELEKRGLLAAKSGQFEESRRYLLQAVHPMDAWDEENEAPWSSADAAFQLGMQLNTGKGGPVDNLTAARCFVLALRSEDAPLDAYLELAAIYRSGHGVPRDPDFAKMIEGKLLLRARQASVSWSSRPADAIRLAEMFIHGPLFPRDLEAAARMYYVANDKNTSRRLQEQAALEGTATAHWSLASSYRGYGWPVTEKNSEKAIWHLQKAGELGMLQAWFELGVMYLLGDGIPKDENKAFYWFQKSPDFSAGYLGLAYWEGRVTNRDPEKARLYLLKASKKDRVASAVLDALASIYRDGIGVTKDPVLAARYSPLVEAKPAVAPAAPKVRRSWEGDASKVVDIHTLLRQQAPVSSWLEYGKALMKATRISSAAIAFSKASELGSAEAELQLGQLYLGDWGMSGDEMSSVVEPLSQNYAKGNELIDAAARKGIRRGSQVESTSDRLEIAPEVAAKKFEGQDPRRLFYLFDVWSSKGGC